MQAKSVSAQNALQQVQKARTELQKTLKAQQTAVTRHEALMRSAASKAQLSTRQLRALNKKQKKLEATLRLTQRRLSLLVRQQEQLEKGEATLKARQDETTLSLVRTLPAAENLQKSPELLLLMPDNGENDALLAPSLIQARLTMQQKEADRITTARKAIHQQQETLDQQTGYLQNQNILQQKRKRHSDQQALLARQQNLEDQQTLETERQKLHQARKNMQDLTNEIERIAQRETLLKKRLEEQARLLARRHQMAQARKVEQAAQSLSAGKGVARGQGSAPVQGTLVTHWHQTTEAGPATGLTYKVSGAAPVSAPCDGRLLYTGAFRSFGNMVILDCGRSQRFVLAGFGAISASTGQHVSRRNTLGTMPSEGGELFVQLRQGTHIINPAPFLR
ncbi:peptidoglycan DD-metalloendopeptidase family protein [Acetobacteraceae bacterium ESL0709]|nr:peptidoglycan DD-metalloendopeptidase family protein [Acetobacteraceae bacterium ESL0709]